MSGFATPAGVRSWPVGIDRLRDLAIEGLQRMYRADEERFAFRLRREGSRVVLEGSSLRYTSIALIGLATEDIPSQTSVLNGRTAREACERLAGAAGRADNLGDVAVSLWAAAATGASTRQALVLRLHALRPAEASYPTVEVAWALAALCAAPDTATSSLAHELSARLIASYNPRSSLFPHVLGGQASIRAHVCCFADLVYPIHALARYAERTGHDGARSVAVSGAGAVCRHQGPAGQWWWHYDQRTGAVIERYPVYAVHQDAMAPMAFAAVSAVSNQAFDHPLARGLDWLAAAPELGGRSLIDERAGVIWRKVARREPLRLSRYAQATASWLHPRLRVPALDAMAPPIDVDYEDRPYHLGWLLHVWPRPRAS